jgi:hypothetical protein
VISKGPYRIWVFLIVLDPHEFDLIRCGDYRRHRPEASAHNIGSVKDWYVTRKKSQSRACTDMVLVKMRQVTNTYKNSTR